MKKKNILVYHVIPSKNICTENSAVNLHDYDIRYEALQEGAQKQAIEAAINLLKMKVGTSEQIAQAQGLTLEKVLELKEQVDHEIA